MGEFTYIGTGKLIALGQSALRAAVVEAGEDLLGKVQAATPVETGTLRASEHTEGPFGSASTIRIRVQTGGEASEYAIPVHEGTAPHVILPKNRKALAFGGIVVRKVNHPGTRAFKYMEGPLIAERATYRAFIAAAAREVF